MPEKIIGRPGMSGEKLPPTNKYGVGQFLAMISPYDVDAKIAGMAHIKGDQADTHHCYFCCLGVTSSDIKWSTNDRVAVVNRILLALAEIDKDCPE